MKVIGMNMNSNTVDYLTYTSDHSGKSVNFDRSLSAEPAVPYVVVMPLTDDVVALDAPAAAEQI